MGRRDGRTVDMSTGNVDRTAGWWETDRTVLPPDLGPVDAPAERRCEAGAPLGLE